MIDGTEACYNHWNGTYQACLEKLAETGGAQDPTVFLVAVGVMFVGLLIMGARRR